MTYEATILEALDALESNRFWAEAEAAASWRRALPEEERRRRQAHEREIDHAFESLE